MNALPGRGQDRSARPKVGLPLLLTVILAGMAACQAEPATPVPPTPGAATRDIFGREEGIAFAGGPGLVDRLDILVMNADGSQIACIACDELLRPVRTAPRWSPDGRAVAYATDFLGASPVTQSSIDVVLDEGRTINLVLGPDGFEHPTWSPDGSEIAFTYRRRLGDDPNQPGAALWADPQICAVPFRSTGTPIPIGQMRCLTSSGWNGQADWSPDGTSIAFAYSPSSDRDATSDILVMSPDGAEKVNLTSSPDDFELNPKWSPDGKQIAFERWDSSLRQHDVWVMDADGSNATNLTPTAEDGRYPTWSPDGRRIVFVTTRTSQPDQPACEGGCLGYNEIYIMDADGSNPVNITNDPRVYSELPDWRPRQSSASSLPWPAGGGVGILVIAGAIWALRRRGRPQGPSA